MAGRVIVIQASSSEDESMPSLVIGGGDGDTTDLAGEARAQTDETAGSDESKNTYRYDREDMLKLYNHPWAKVRPAILSPEFDLVVANGEGGTGDSAIHTKLWSPELWIQSIWNPEPRQNNAAGWSARRQLDHDGHGQPMNKKKQIDRLKTENEDGIVLSPQRRSFGAGCQVNASSTVANANAAGSQVGGGGAPTNAGHPIRRSASPISGGGDDRQQQSASHSNVRSSFRGRGGGGGGPINAPIPQQPSQVQNANPTPGSGNYGRGDRVENWRDRSGFSSSFGRGSMGKDSPATINIYNRSRGGGMNSWNTGGGNRRSYGGGGYQQYGNEPESLPEWVTEGPSDMFETMELRGFDEEERQEMQLEQNGSGSGQKRGGGAGRIQQYRSSSHGFDAYGEKDQSARRSIERAEQNQNYKRDNKSPGPQQSSRKSAGDGDKTGKMPAEALVDGFDIGDMAQFLSAAGADFDSIANGDVASKDKSAAISNAIPVPATPTAASRFSKFFAGQGAGNGNAAPKDKADKGMVQKEQQPQQAQSVNIMELFSKAAVAGNKGQAAPAVVPGTAPLPVGAKSLDEIEADFKPKRTAPKSEVDGSPNKVLQELFQSARSVDPAHGPVQDPRLHAESHQKGDERMAADGGNQRKTMLVVDPVTQEELMDRIIKDQTNMASNGPPTSTKGNPLADPAQQQHFLETLRKLQIKQQSQMVAQQQQGDQSHRPPNAVGPNEANPFLAAYPQLAGLQHLLQQQQQQAMQMGNLQAAMNAAGRVPSPLGGMPGVVPVPHQAAGPSGVPGQPMNPAFAGFLPPSNVPPPPITQQDLLLAHTQSIYQRAMMNRKFQGIEEQQPPPKPSVLQQSVSGGGKTPAAFLPTAVIKQMHGGVKLNKEGSEEPNVAAAARPIVKQQPAFPGQQQEQISPNSVNEQLLRSMQQPGANKAPMPVPGVAAGAQQQPMAPPPSLTPQDVQRLIEQSHLQQRQRQQQERVLLEQYAKTQQQQQPQVGASPAGPAAVNPAAVTAALALQNNPMFVQMLRAQAMQQAMLQQQAAAVAGSGMPQASPQPIPASAAVSAIPNAAQLVRARLAAPPPVPAAAASNPELMRQIFQQQQQQMLLNQMRQQAPAEAGMLLNRLLTGQAVQQQQMHQMPAVPPQPSVSSLGGLHFPGQGMADVKPMTLEELERLHKQTAAMQQPQS